MTIQDLKQEMKNWMGEEVDDWKITAEGNGNVFFVQTVKPTLDQLANLWALLKPRAIASEVYNGPGGPKIRISLS